MLAVGGLSGCQRAADSGSGAAHPGETDRSPDALYQSVYTDYLHGNLDLAERRAGLAVQTFSQAGAAADPTWALRFRLLQAEVRIRQSRARDALDLLSNLGAGAPLQGNLAIKFNLLCTLAHSRLKQSDIAAGELAEARRLAEASHSSLIDEVLRAEALIERDAGHMDQALEKFRQSLAAARAATDPLVQAADMVDIGFVHLQSDRFDEAVVFSQQAADFARSVQAHRQVQLAVGNIGWAYQSLGDFEHALANFQDAERESQQLGLALPQAWWLQDMGLAAYRLGQFEDARKYDEEGLRLAARLPAGEGDKLTTNIEANLALLFYEQGQYAAAKQHSDAATRAAAGSKDVNVTAYCQVLQGLLAMRLNQDQEAERIFTQIRKQTTDADIRTDAENALANLYVSRHQSKQAESWYRRSIQTFEDKRSEIHSEALRLTTFGYGDAVYRDYANFLIDTHRPAEALELLDRSRARTLEEGLRGDGLSSQEAAAAAAKRPPLKAASQPTAQAVARKLGAPILFYALGPKQSYLWVITPEQTHLLTLPKERDIQSWVEAYQKAILKSTDPIETPPPSAVSLYNTLIQPAAAWVPPGSRVYIIPDGVLHALNFETLPEPTQSGSRYWIEHVTITTASSIAMLARLKPVVSDAIGGRKLLLIGNPLPAQAEFEALPNAADEIEKVRRHFPTLDQTVLTQAQAVPAAYQESHPEQFQYIHFVAHGTASRLVPLDSAVVLSPEHEHPEIFKLYARDITRQPLNAQLVTISACFGSGVRAYAGEGLIGLAWVFLRAGSHNVIGALWQANDASTPLLMDRMYDGIQAGKTADAALREAKLTLIHSPNVYRKPFYWGAFQLYAGS